VSSPLPGRTVPINPALLRAPRPRMAVATPWPRTLNLPHLALPSRIAPTKADNPAAADRHLRQQID